MAIEVGDKIYRNLPEQVEWLSNQFVRILEAFEELGTVMRYKGSVATYADLPADNNKVGDVYNVIDTGNNYAWDGEGWDEIGSTVDLSNLVTLDTAQDIPGLKTFVNNVKIKNDTENVRSWVVQATSWSSYRINDGSGDTYFALYNSSGQKRVGPGVDATNDLGSQNERWKDLYLAGRIYLSENSYLYASTYYIYSKGHFYPDYTGTYDLGASTYKWRDLYLGGIINKNASGYGLSLPDTSTFTANSELLDTSSTQTISGVKTFSNGLKTTILYNQDGTEKLDLSGGAVVVNNIFRPKTDGTRDLGTSSYKWRDICLFRNLSDGTNSVTVAEIAKKPTTVSIPIDDQTNTADLSSYSGKIVVLYAADTAGGTWEVTFTLPSTIVAVGITKSGSTQIEISGTSITNHTLNIINLDELDTSAFCVIDLSDGLTAKVMAGRNF